MIEYILLGAILLGFLWLFWSISKGESVDRRIERHNRNMREQILSKQKEHREALRREIESKSGAELVDFLNELHSDKDSKDPN